MENMAVALTRLAAALEQSGSLKTLVPSVGECFEFYESRHVGMSCKRVRDLLKAWFKDCVADESFQDVFDRRFLEFAQQKTRLGDLPTIGTLNRYKGWCRAVLRFCKKRRFIAHDPICDYGIDVAAERARDQELTGKQFADLLEKYKGDPLLPGWRFAAVNPIRIPSDLYRLRREWLDLSKPWIEFEPWKTREKRRENVVRLIEIEPWMIEYWDSLPKDCPLLFPWFDGKTWRPMGNPKKHARKILDNAGLEWFHVHDFRGMAMTHYVDTYGPWLVEQLGVASANTIRRYYRKSKNRLAQQVKKAREQGAAAVA